MIHSFLLIGQSNMAGRGFVSEAVPVDLSRIKLLRNGLWTPAFRPFSADRGFAGVCLAERFAEKCTAEQAADAGIIACADGGTRLEQWMPGQPLYDNAVNNARLAMRSSQLAGILWHQGESDMADGRRQVYEQNFKSFLQALRRDLGAEDVPFLIGGLGDFLAECSLIAPEVRCNYTKVNKILEAIAAQEKNVGFVSAKGLGANPDNLHFSAAALHEFGLRYYEEYKKLSFAFAGKEDGQDSRTALELL